MNWLASSAFRFASAPLFSAALLFALAGCEDPNDLGVELPGTTPINTEYRDYPVTASTILQTPVETLNSNRFLVGRFQDTKLGTTTAKAFLNLQLTLSPTTSSAPDTTTFVPSQFTTPLTLDSVVVVAGFDQVYGSSSQPVSFNVYNLGSPLDNRANYNSTSTVPLGDLIGSDLKSSLDRTIVQQQLNGLKTRTRNADGSYTSTSIDSTTSVTVPDRSVRLALYRRAVGTKPEVPSAFAQSVFNAIKDRNTTFTQARLNELWKGIALVPSDNFTSSIVGFNRTLENRVLFYYHVGSGKSKQPFPFPLSFGSTNTANTPRAFTQLQTALLAPFNQLTDISKSVFPSAPDQVTYMQEGLGLATKLEIPGLTELVNNREGLAINRAELIVPLKPYANLVFPTPKQAFLYELDANNKVLQRTVPLSQDVFVSQYERIVQGNGSNPRDFRNNATAVLYDLGPTNKYYSMSVTTYLQAYVYELLGAERPAAFMFYPVVRYSPTATDLSLNRAILDAQNIKLRVYFSKLR